jgi:type II secretory pathway component PulF
VRVGETSGTLAANLSYLADELRKSRELKNRIKSASIYPIVVMVATVSIVGFLVFFVFPKVIPLFASLNVPLPTTTKILIGTAQFILTYWIWIFAGLAGLAVLLKVLLSFKPVKYVFDRSLFFLPIASTLIINVNMANLSRVLAILLKGGIKIVDAVTITAATFDNLVYKRALLEASDEVKRGEPLAKYLEEHNNIFPLMLSGLVEVGENTGNLEENLSYLSDFFQEEVDFSLKNLTSIIEPALLLIMGLVVGFVAISIITPIYQITQGVK